MGGVSRTGLYHCRGHGPAFGAAVGRGAEVVAAFHTSAHHPSLAAFEQMTHFGCHPPNGHCGCQQDQPNQMNRDEMMSSIDSVAITINDTIKIDRVNP